MIANGQFQMPVCLLQTWTQTTTYLQLVGILMGQVFFGVMGDAVGRRAAMLTDMVRYLWKVIHWTVMRSFDFADAIQAALVASSRCIRKPPVLL